MAKSWDWVGIICFPSQLIPTGDVPNFCHFACTFTVFLWYSKSLKTFSKLSQLLLCTFLILSWYFPITFPSLSNQSYYYYIFHALSLNFPRTFLVLFWYFHCTFQVFFKFYLVLSWYFHRTFIVLSFSSTLKLCSLFFPVLLWYFPNTFPTLSRYFAGISTIRFQYVSGTFHVFFVLS